MYRKKNVSSQVVVMAVAGLLVFCLIWLISGLFSSPSKQAVKAVNDFYSYEQKANFSDSWELFHPVMKERFGKGSYIQDRAHVFMNHFGVDTFTYKVEKAQKISGWKVSKDAKPFNDVYKMKVIQTYKGKYGNFDLHQEVFAVKEKGDWKIVWDYTK